MTPQPVMAGLRAGHPSIHRRKCSTWMAWGRLATAYRRPAMTSGVGESEVNRSAGKGLPIQLGPEGATSGRVEYEKMEYAFVDRHDRRRGADPGGSHPGGVTTTGCLVSQWTGIRRRKA